MAVGIAVVVASENAAAALGKRTWPLFVLTPLGRYTLPDIRELALLQGGCVRMRMVRLLACAVVLGLAGCMSVPKDKETLKSQFPREVTLSFEASLDEVLASFLRSSEICGKAWRQSLAQVVGWASAPTFKHVHQVSADGKSATLEIWSMNTLYSDYLFELIELREAVPGRVDVVHFQGEPHESPKTPRPKDLATWHSAESPKCQ